MKAGLATQEAYDAANGNFNVYGPSGGAGKVQIGDLFARTGGGKYTRCAGPGLPEVAAAKL